MVNQYDLYASSARAKNYFAGSVGIGNANPIAKLHVNTNSGIGTLSRGNFEVRGNSLTSGESLATIRGYYQALDPDSYLLKVGISGPSNWERFVVKSDGNVGIGTINPDEKLAVNGNIHTKEVRVDLTGWSDFVFEENYDLPTLQEVETHIKEKGHLENIPSAEEVEADGIKLGEMNAKLLQKIEELTLYTIEQEKKLQSQTKQIEMLESNYQDLLIHLRKIEKE